MIMYVLLNILCFQSWNCLLDSDEHLRAALLARVLLLSALKHGVGNWYHALDTAVRRAPVVLRNLKEGYE